MRRCLGPLRDTTSADEKVPSVYSHTPHRTASTRWASGQQLKQAAPCQRAASLRVVVVVVVVVVVLRRRTVTMVTMPGVSGVHPPRRCLGRFISFQGRMKDSGTYLGTLHSKWFSTSRYLRNMCSTLQCGKARTPAPASSLDTVTALTEGGVSNAGALISYHPLSIDRQVFVLFSSIKINDKSARTLL
ncbi:hypothetical protein LZ30DRAFT_442508 [Colletotrichum cereale]|nr:hypothetical protein LZ30DRAFT_442508 [Colletotrichum cereale]